VIDVFDPFKVLLWQIQAGFPPGQETLFQSSLHINYARILWFHKIREVTPHPFIVQGISFIMEVWYLIANSYGHGIYNVFVRFNIFICIVNSCWVEVNVSGSVSYKVAVSGILQETHCGCGHAGLSE
jgi:hypothetical protein